RFAAAGWAYECVRLAFLHPEAVVPEDLLSVGVVEADVPELEQRSVAVGSGAIGIPAVAIDGGQTALHGNRDQVGFHRNDTRDAVPPGDSHLESSPKGRQLAQRVVEAGHINKIADQESGGKLTDGDQIDAIHQYDHLAHRRQKAVHRREDVVGDARTHGSGIIGTVSLIETLAKIIPAVEGQHALEVVQALLYLGAEPSDAFQVQCILLFYPG